VAARSRAEAEAFPETLFFSVQQEERLLVEYVLVLVLVLDGWPVLLLQLGLG
jgi:hypothetical protein